MLLQANSVTYFCVLIVYLPFFYLIFLHILCSLSYSLIHFLSLCRHELPVTSVSPAILVNNEEFLVVDKPSSIPIHPCGRYRHNSLLYILAKEHGFRNLRCKYAFLAWKTCRNASVGSDWNFVG